MGNFSRVLTQDDIYFFEEGTNTQLGDVLGAHVRPEGGTQFAVWAPNARSVSVIGTFNGWNKDATPLTRGAGGIWQGFASEARVGAHYKYSVESNSNEYHADKADPMGFLQDAPPGNASVIWDLDYQWGDESWMAGRRAANSLDAPISILRRRTG
jgi:1,4-alpha-glucan branching enzyme